MCECSNKAKQKIIWRGYEVNENTQLADTNVIQYFFRNRGTTWVKINGMVLYPSTLAPEFAPQVTTAGDEFLEHLNPCCEKSFGDYTVEFIDIDPDDKGIRRLLVYTKTYVEQGGDY